MFRGAAGIVRTGNPIDPTDRSNDRSVVVIALDRFSTALMKVSTYGAGAIYSLRISYSWDRGLILYKKIPSPNLFLINDSVTINWLVLLIMIPIENVPYFELKDLF